MADPHPGILETLRANGIDITDTTDVNDDVSLHLVLNQSGDEVGLALSCVGPFAAILHQDAEENFDWVTRADDAPTKLAAMVARTVEQAGMTLLDRDIVSQRIATNWWDGSKEVTIYQLLFSDVDVIP